MRLMFVVGNKRTMELAMACGIKDEQYHLGGVKQYYLPHLTATKHEYSAI